MRIVQTFILALLLWLAAASPSLAAKIGDLVQQQSTSTGTGNFTLSAISDGTRSFNAEFGTGGTDKFYYFIQNESAVEWEIGTGHLSAASTMVRDTVITSSNGNALVNFSAGTKDIVNDLPASLQTQLETLSSDLSGKQPLDSDLTSIAALGSGADKGLYTTAANTWAEYTLTAAGRALIDDADAAAQRTTLGLGTLSTQSGTFSGTSSGTNTGDQTTVSGNAGTVTTADAGSDTTTWPLLGNAQTGNQAPASDAGLTYNASTDNLTTTTFTGALAGNATTATALATPRTIGGTSFDGSANIVPDTINSINEATDTTTFPLFITASGTQALQPKNNTSLTFNSSTATLGATNLSGTLTTAAQTNITSVGTLTGGATGAGFTVALTTSTVTGNLPFVNNTTSVKFTAATVIELTSGGI